MEEGRHVFQEGNAFTLEALQHKVLHHTPLESRKLRTVMLNQIHHMIALLLDQGAEVCEVAMILHCVYSL